MRHVRTACATSRFSRVLITLILVFAILTRFLFLRNHQINHDESIYVLDSLKYLKGGYRFDPEQHGPFLFFLNMVIFRLFGASASTILLGPAASGLTLVILPLFLLGVTGVDRRSAIIASALLAASPSLMYFSRMLKNDIYVATFLLATAVFGIRYLVERRQSDQYLCAAFLGLLLATRVDAIFHSFVFIVFLLICFLMFRHRTPIKPDPSSGFMIARTAALSFGVFFAVHFFFYSILPGNLMGFWQNMVALFRFWRDRHQLNLLPGPATYYAELMFQYELPILALFFFGLGRQLEANRISKIVFRCTFILFVILLFYGGTRLPFFETRLHAGTLAEVSFIAYVALLGVWGTLTFLRQRKILHAFLLYWAAAGNLFYAVAGEKQPQIVLFALLPIILLTALFLSEYLQATDFGRLKPVHTAIWGVAFTFYVYMAIVVCFVTYYYPSERLSNATTSPEVGQFRELLVRKSKETELGEALPVKFMFTFSSDVLAWYLREFPNKLYSHQLERFYPVIIFHNYKRGEYRGLLEKHYDHFKIHTNLGSGYNRHLILWPAGPLVESLYREMTFQIFRWTFRPIPGAYIDVYIQKPHATISPDDQRRLTRLNEIFSRRTVPVVSQFGSRGSLPGELREASDMELDRGMNLYVADTLNRRVTKYAQDGTHLYSIEDEKHPFVPEGLGLCEATRSLYVALPSANEVRQYSLSGRYLKSIEYSFITPMDVACDAAGNVFVTDRSPRKVLKFDRSGREVVDWTVPGSLFQSPASIKIDRTTAEILITDISYRRVLRLDRNGRLLASVELPGISEAQWQLFFDLDSLGNLFIPDLSNSRILVLDRSGNPFMVIGEESRGYGGVLGPSSVAVREKRMYVYSRYLERITGFNIDGLPIYDRAVHQR